MVGLGNPGARYAGTRHNAGQLVVQALAERLGAGRSVARYAGRLAEARGPHGPLALLVPGTYMNASGDSVGPAAGALRAAPERVLVVHDEVDLPFGTVRGKVGGGVGGHNGLRSVRAGLGSADFLRVRLGVGRPTPEWRGDDADWVLARFAEPDQEVAAMIALGRDMAEVAVAEGMDAAIARFHAREPGARARARALGRREQAGDPGSDPGAPGRGEGDGPAAG